MSAPTFSFSWGFKFSLFIIVGVVCAAVGYWNGIFADGQVVNWIRYFGYWAVLASTLLWVTSLYQAYPTAFRPSGWSWLVAPRFRWAILAVLALFLMMQFKETKSFKILLDEPVLVNTSRMMHFERQVYVVSNSQRVDGILAAKGYVDKRPNFFPFLVSVVHDITGYRPENAFYLNSLLTLILLGLTFSVGRQLGGDAGGWISLALIASIPLVWHQAAGAGFEVLNLVMFLATLKIAIDLLQNPTSAKLSALALTAIMFAQVRYESVLFVIPVIIVGLMSYTYAKKPMLPWGVWVSPILLIGILWQQRVFNISTEFWELFTVGVTQPFSFDYYAANIAQAVFFFFQWAMELPNAPLVAWIGSVSILIFIVRMCLRLVVAGSREDIVDNRRPHLALWVFFIGVGLYFTLLMCYAFDLSRYMVVRLTLPVYLTMALAAAVVCGEWIRGRLWYRAVGAVVALGFTAWTLPSVACEHYAKLYIPGQEAIQAQYFVRERLSRGERFMIIADMSMLWTSYDIETIPNRAVNHQLSEVKYFLENPNNIPMYVVQSLEYNPAVRRWDDTASEPLTPRARLQPIWERPVGSFRMLRISRLMDLEGVAPVDDTDLYKDGDPQNLSEWVKHLP